MADNLPLPDEATLATFWRDAATAPLPTPQEWAELLTGLRWAAEVQHQGKDAPNMPAGATAAQIALSAVVAFLERDCVLRDGASMPLIELQGALLDLSSGRVSPMFKPVSKPAHNPGKGRSEALRIGMTARAMSLLMDGGSTEDAAAQRVGRALGIKPTTVKNWRDRMEQGHGPGASREAVAHYAAPLPDWPGSTPTQQGEQLLDLLKARAPFRPKSQ